MPHELSGEDECYVCEHAEQWVPTLCLRHTAHLICEAPEEQGYHNGAPELGASVECAKRPKLEDADEGRESRGKACSHACGHCGWMQQMQVGKDDACKEPEECCEACDERVENCRSRHAVHHAGVQHGNANCCGQIYISLEEWDNFCTARCDHQDVFCVTQNRVVEEDAKQHEGQRQHLLQLLFLWQSLPDRSCSVPTSKTNARKDVGHTKEKGASSTQPGKQ
mmetsp:Transcript_119640/g.220082  ORF Transcript_119640/g.220082 Transcript_119640/m.220082 type:complete len:223 (-) Transcript_119640:652-1320(-)